MKIENAKLYEQQIKLKMYEIWYDEKYQYYFNGNERYDFGIQDSNSVTSNNFAILNDSDELIGYVSYRVCLDTRVAYNFSAINFSDDKITFGIALKHIINDIFTKFGMNVLEWFVVSGNPAQKSYDKMINKLGGKVVGILHNRARDMSGNLHDNVIYEILKENYMSSRFYLLNKLNKIIREEN